LEKGGKVEDRGVDQLKFRDLRTPLIPPLAKGGKVEDRGVISMRRIFFHVLQRSPLNYLRGVSAGQGVITSTMTRIYNRKKDQQKRRNLRKNMPKSEVLLWMKLKNRQMHGERFLRQYGVDQYILDFYCPNLKLAVEVDGDSHFIPGSEEKDKARQLYIEALGVHFLRFTNTDVCENLDEVCQAILLFLMRYK